MLATVRGHVSGDPGRIDHVVALATALFAAAREIETPGERRRREMLGSLAGDERSKAITTALADQLHRPRSAARMKDQLAFLVRELGAPHQLSALSRLALEQVATNRWMPADVLRHAVELGMRQETAGLVHDATPKAIAALVRERAELGIRVNWNLLGEAVLGEREASERVERYRALLAIPEVQSISVKVSSIASQRSLFAVSSTVDDVVPRLQRIYEAAVARAHPVRVTLDMEGYDDVESTIEAFRRAIDRPDLARLEPGIVLQAYLPDAHALYEELLSIARARSSRGYGACRLRIVKGANLAMERHLAAVSGLALPIHASKPDTDASALRLVERALDADHTRVLRVGVGSHNVFDLAHALVLGAERGLLDGNAPGVELEMLEGMADPLCRVVARLAHVVVYAPLVDREDFGSAVAYLVRRLDENTSKENHLARSFALPPRSAAFDLEAARFTDAMRRRKSLDETPRRARRVDYEPGGFRNEPDTDFGAHAPREAIVRALEITRSREGDVVASLVAGQARGDAITAGFDPSRPDAVAYRIRLGDESTVALALESVSRSPFGRMPAAERAAMLRRVATAMRAERAELVAAIVLDVGKRAIEADAEVSEAIDFAEYYAHSLLELDADRSIALVPRGPTLVLAPWNFPLAIGAGSVFAALAAGHPVVYKPAPESPLVAHRFVALAHAAGVPTDALALVLVDDLLAPRLASAPEFRLALLTGGTDTARAIRRATPSLRLYAETGGKNATIVTSMADLDLAIADVLRSAFGFAGQKCSATSLLICESDVYDDRGFRDRLVDAAKSLVVGSAWERASFVTPLIRPPAGPLARAMQKLDDQESWLLPPRVDVDNPRLVHPALRLGVTRGSFCHRTELFGPVLGLMRADSLDDAIAIANDTGYGLTAGLESLDVREQERFVDRIRAGNVYVNRGTTGAIVRRQPFGGVAASQFGAGVKAGGPNTVLAISGVSDRDASADAVEPKPAVKAFVDSASGLSDEQRARLRFVARRDATLEAAHFGRTHDPDAIATQVNAFRYRPHEGAMIAVGWDVSRYQVAREAIAMILARGRADLVLFAPFDPMPTSIAHDLRSARDRASIEAALRSIGTTRLRLLGRPPPELLEACAACDVFVDDSPFVEASRVVLHHARDEQSLSVELHRYGNPVRPSPRFDGPLSR